MASYPLNGKVALVTGAARGIGLETAKLLHERGASVALLDLDTAATEQAAREVGPRTIAIGADVTDREAMDAATQAVVDHFGRLDVPVANAGVAPPTATARAIDDEAFERTLDVDLYGVWRTVRPALPHVVEHGGQVVVISSVYAWMNGALNAPYAAAKAGVEALGRALGLELAVHGAGATVAHFGFIDTDMVRDAFEDPLASRMQDRLPGWMLRRLTPAQAAHALVAGIECRAPRVIVPRWWTAWFALRGVAGPLTDRLFARDQELLGLIREADADDRAALRGGLDRTAGSRPTRTAS
jgi:NAD(P)-dependent dehydrogenase (short-subunit alcohol dehydrogenase family)